MYFYSLRVDDSNNNHAACESKYEDVKAEDARVKADDSIALRGTLFTGSIIYIYIWYRCRKTNDMYALYMSSYLIVLFSVMSLFLQCNAYTKVLDLKKTYKGANGQPDVQAVKTLTIGVSSGECVGFLGPNGAGKSTTMNMLW